MAGRERCGDRLAEDDFGCEIIDERRSRQPGVEVAAAQAVNERGDRQILSGENDVRIARGKRAHDRRDDVVADRRQEADAEYLSFADRGAPDAIKRPIGLGHERSGLPEQSGAEVGELNPARSAGE
jgi:hypothetical protein